MTLPDTITLEGIGAVFRHNANHVYLEALGLDASTIPVMIEIPNTHIPSGGNVLFLDGHVEFMKMGGEFPMTPAFTAALASIDD